MKGLRLSASEPSHDTVAIRKAALRAGPSVSRHQSTVARMARPSSAITPAAATATR